MLRESALTLALTPALTILPLHDLLTRSLTRSLANIASLGFPSGADELPHAPSASDRLRLEPRFSPPAIVRVMAHASLPRAILLALAAIAAVCGAVGSSGGPHHGHDGHDRFMGSGWLKYYDVQASVAIARSKLAMSRVTNLGER